MSLPHLSTTISKPKASPAALFPNTVKSYSLYPMGRLESTGPRLFLHGQVRDLGLLRQSEPISASMCLMALLWLPVKGISVSDPSSGLILFDIGVAHKQLSLSLLEVPPLCGDVTLDL